MDRDHLEPHLGLRPDQHWLRPLLRADAGQALEGDGPAEIPDRRRPPHLRAGVRRHVASRRAARAAWLAEAPEGVRRQHGRRHARQGPGRLPRAGLGGHGPDAAAHLPDPHQAPRALRARPRRALPLRRRAPAQHRLPPPGPRPQPPAGPRPPGRPAAPLAPAERLAWHLHRARRLRPPRRRPTSRIRNHALPQPGAAPWPATQPRPCRHRLGHRRWGERPRSATHASRLGA
jgi:hypothetical protein